VEQFDHHCDHFAQHWRQIYRELRGSWPIADSKLHRGFSVVARCEDVKQVLADPATFASGPDLVFDGDMVGDA
jgi:cytochrome P450